MSLRSSGTCCAVRGCTNNQRKLNLWLQEQCLEHAPRTKRECSCESRYSFHRLPRDEEPRRMWLKNLNLIKPPQTLYVCSFHFVDKKPTENNPHPTLWLGNGKPPEKRRRVLRRSDISVTRTDVSQTSQPQAISGSDDQMITMMTSTPHERLAFNRAENEQHVGATAVMDPSLLKCDADTETSPEKEYFSEVQLAQVIADHKIQAEELAALRLEHQNVLLELHRLQEENRKLKEQLTGSTFGTEYLRRGNSDKLTSFYTGLPNFKVFLWLVTLLQHSLPCFAPLSMEDTVLLVLIKLKLNLRNFDIANRFKISKTIVSDVLDRCIPIMADNLKFLIHWPGKEDVLQTLPKVFKSRYKNVRSIIDYTEICVDRPGHLTGRASTWSVYKHNNTLKYLVSITPSGAISFISRAFGGRVSNKVVTQRSGYLDLLENGDLVLAHRAVLIAEEIMSKNCQLVIPSFTKAKTQLTQQQVENCRHMSGVRIHVARAIGRLKVFGILNGQMRLDMVPHCDSILTICSGICNLQPKLVT